MNTKWTDKITNEELWRITQQKPKENQIKRRKLNWIGHTLCKEIRAIEKTALEWNPQGYRKTLSPSFYCFYNTLHTSLLACAFFSVGGILSGKCLSSSHSTFLSVE